MKNINIDELYCQLDKHLLLAQSYTEISDLFFIFKACRLKPFDFIFSDKTSKLILYRHWFDEFGNSLHITNSKKIKLTYNDISLDRTKIICTDLYYGLSLDKIARMSKVAYLSMGKDDDFNQTCGLITFLGIDNYLRTYSYLYGEWQQVSPLLLGLKHLKTLAQSRDTRAFRSFSIKENTALPCADLEQWVTFIPPSQAMMSLLNKKYDGIFSFLNKE